MMKYLSPLLIAELLVSSFAISIFGLATSIFSILVLRRYVGLGADSTLVTLTIGVIIALVLENVLRRSRSSILEHIHQKVDRDLSMRTLAGFVQTEQEALDNLSMAEKREILGAPHTMLGAFNPANLGAILDAPFAMVYLLVLWIASPGIAIFTALACVMGLVVSVSGIYILKEPAAQASRFGAKGAILGQFLSSAGEVIRAFSAMPIIRHQWEETQGMSSEKRREVQVAQSYLQQAGALIASLLSVATYAYGAKQVVLGHLDIGVLIGLNILSSRCFATLNRLNAMSEGIAKAKRASMAFSDLLNLPLEAVKGIVPVSLSGGIEFTGVSISYPGQPLAVIEDLNLLVEPAKIVGITGPNGAGKTSLIRTILGLRHPAKGLIKVDGMEMRQLVPQWWRQQIAYAPQDLHFFEGTIKENMLVRQPDFSEEELLKLCEVTGLSTFLLSRPEGLQTTIAGTGDHLPMGVRRRMALIRAMVGPSKIVLFDEPTEALDAMGMQSVAQLLNMMARQKKTVFIATNEAFILQACDQVIHLDSSPKYKIVLAGNKGSL